MSPWATETEWGPHFLLSGAQGLTLTPLPTWFPRPALHRHGNCGHENSLLGPDPGSSPTRPPGLCPGVRRRNPPAPGRASGTGSWRPPPAPLPPARVGWAAAPSTQLTSSVCGCSAVRNHQQTNGHVKCFHPPALMKVQSEIAVPCTKQDSLISPKPKTGSRACQAGEEASPLGPPPARPPPPPVLQAERPLSTFLPLLGVGSGSLHSLLGLCLQAPTRPAPPAAPSNSWEEGLRWEFLDSGTWVDDKLPL